MVKSHNVLTAVLTLGVLIILALSSCTSQSGKREHKYLLQSVARAKIVEGNHHLITQVYLDSVQIQVYRPLDTVWVNMTTHKIDDTDQYAMACVLYQQPTE